MTTSTSLRIFLSYPRLEREVAEQVVAILVRYHHRMSVWWDNAIEPSRQWRKDIEDEIDRTDVFIVVVSEQSEASDFCRAETTRAERLHRERGRPRIIPLEVDDTKAEALGVGEAQAVAFQRWRTEADTIFTHNVIPAIDPTIATSRHRIREGLCGAVAELVDWAAATRGLPEAQAARLIDVAYGVVGCSDEPTDARARVLRGVAGLQLTRQRWRDMEGAAGAGISLLEPERTDNSEGAERDWALAGDLWLACALAQRRQGRISLTHIDAARQSFERIDDPLERAERLAQLHREVGTWEQASGNDSAAVDHFRASGALLQGLPSQRYHVAQASIKEAQVLLSRGDPAAAERKLAGVRALFKNPEVTSPRAAEVHRHLLITSAMVHASLGRDDAARRALGELGTARTPRTATDLWSIAGRAGLTKLLLRAPLRIRLPMLRAAYRIGQASERGRR